MEVSLPLPQYTGAAPFPVLGLPTFLQGNLDDGELRVGSIKTVLASGAGALPTDSPAVRAGAKGYRLPVRYDQKSIARMVAKIAHGLTVEWLGLDGFTPYLPPMILGHSQDLGRWVGSPSASLFDEAPDRGHRFRVGTLDDSPLLIAGVHVFADSGAPEYLVVVGQMLTVAK